MSKVKKFLQDKTIPTGGHEFYQIPVLGEVHVHHDEWNGSGSYSLGEMLQNFRKEDRQTITVRALDNALTEAGILQGDLLTIDLKQRLRDGDIVAVIFGEKLFIRKIYFHKNFIRLETSEESPSPIILDEKTPDFHLLGKVTMVVREL